MSPAGEEETAKSGENGEEKGETGGQEEEGGTGAGEGKTLLEEREGGRTSRRGGRWEGRAAKCDSELRGRRKDEKARNQLQGKDERGEETEVGGRMRERGGGRGSE